MSQCSFHASTQSPTSCFTLVIALVTSCYSYTPANVLAALMFGQRPYVGSGYCCSGSMALGCPNAEKNHKIFPKRYHRYLDACRAIRCHSMEATGHLHLLRKDCGPIPGEKSLRGPARFADPVDIVNRPTR